jgi:O-antigen ligase
MKKFSSINKPSFWSGLIILATIFITPIIFSYFYPLSIDLVKIVTFRVFWWLLLFTTVWQLIIDERFFNRSVFMQAKAWWLLGLFLVSSLFFSVNPWLSWFGSYDRQEGLSSWLFYLSWFWLVVIYLQRYKDNFKIEKIRLLFKTASLSALFVSLYAILQVLGIDFVSWSEPAKLTGRAFSFLGQPNFLACFLILVLPLSFYLFKKSLDKSRYFWLFAFITQLIALLLTGSRAAVAVFIFISLFFLLFLFIKNKKISFLKLSLSVGGVFLVVITFLAILFFSNKDRFLEITNPKRGSFLVRQELLVSGFQSFLQKPLIGYGLENQSEVYALHYKVDWAYYAQPNTYSDRAHNIVLDILLTSGILGLIVFLVFGFWVFSMIRLALKKADNYLIYALSFSLVVYFFSLLFNFSVTVTSIYFWLFLAIIFSLINEDITSELKNKRGELFKIIIIGAIFIVSCYGIVLESKRVIADYYYHQAIVKINQGEYFTAIVLRDYLLENNPNLAALDYYERGLLLYFIEHLPTISKKVDIAGVLQVISLAEGHLFKNSFESVFTRGLVFGALGKSNQSDEIFQKISLVSPEMPKIYLAWGDSLLFNKQSKQAALKFQQALKLLPDTNFGYLTNEEKNRIFRYKNLIESRLEKIKF